MNILPQQQNESANLPVQEQRRVQYATPLVDVESTEDGYTIRAEMPGVDKSGLEITVENGELTIVGHRQTVSLRVNQFIARSGTTTSGACTNSIRPSTPPKSALASSRAFNPDSAQGGER